MSVTSNTFVRGKDLPDQRNFIKTNVAPTLTSPVTITGTAPTLIFDDTTIGDDNYSISADADILRIQNTDNNATVLRLVHGTTEDFDLNVNADILSIINTTGPITYLRFRGGANDDIQVDRPITFNSTVSGLTFSDITLTDASPTITFADTDADDYTLGVDASIMSITNTTGNATSVRLIDTAGQDYEVKVDADVLTITNLTSNDTVVLSTDPVVTITPTSVADIALRLEVGNHTSSGIPAIQVLDSTNVQTNVNMRSSGEILVASGFPTNLVDVPTKQIVLGGQFSQNVTTVGNPASGTETDLHSYTIDAFTLANDGDSLDFIGGGTILSAGTGKRLRFYFGGTVFFDTGSIDPSVDETYGFHHTITRIDSDSVIVASIFGDQLQIVGGGQITQINGLNFGTNLTLKATGQDLDATPTSNRVTMGVSTVRKFGRV